MLERQDFSGFLVLHMQTKQIAILHTAAWEALAQIGQCSEIGPTAKHRGPSKMTPGDPSQLVGVSQADAIMIIEEHAGRRPCLSANSLRT